MPSIHPPTTRTERRSPPDEEWPTRPLIEVVDKVFVGVPTSRYAAKAGEDGVSVPVLSVGDIEDDHIVPVHAISSARLRAKDLERFRIHIDDIVVSCRGTLLKTAPVLHGWEGIVASSNIITVRPDRSVVLPQLLLRLFKAPAWRDALKLRSRSATGLMQLTVKDVASLPVPLLPLDLQSELAELADAGEHAYRTAIEAAERRRTLVDGLIMHVLHGPSRKVIR